MACVQWFNSTDSSKAAVKLEARKKGEEIKKDYDNIDFKFFLKQATFKKNQLKIFSKTAPHV